MGVSFYQNIDFLKLQKKYSQLRNLIMTTYKFIIIDY
jgi:hypothetical protein